MPFDIRKAMINAIEKTGDPLAAIKLQEAHKHAEAVGQMLVSMGDRVAVESITRRLLSKFSDKELNEANANFVIALCGCLVTALEQLGRSLAEDN